MIRALAIVSLTALLVLVMYLPSAHPPEAFHERVQAEHAQLARFWAEPHAARIEARTRHAQNLAHANSPIPAPYAGKPSGGVNSAVAREMRAINSRAFDSPYFRSLDALLLLATSRCFILLEWLPFITPFMAAALLDAVTVRALKARLFRPHDPEIFALHAYTAIVLGCATTVGLVLPVTQPVWLPPAACAAFGWLAATVVAHFHARA